MVALEAERDEERQGRVEAEGANAVANAEKALLRELSTQVHEQLMHERAAAAAAAASLEASRADAQARLESVRGELARSCSHAASRRLANEPPPLSDTRTACAPSAPHGVIATISVSVCESGLKSPWLSQGV